MKEIQARKVNLKNEISDLEDSFYSRVSGIKKGAEGIAKTKTFIHKKPLTSVIIATGLGVTAGLLRGKKKVVVKGSVAKESITSFIIRELKQAAARKAMLYFSDFIDQQLAPYHEEGK